MKSIFNFIFECIGSLINFLDFKLPGIELTFLDFTLLVILIPLLFKFVKGGLDELSGGSIFGYLGDSVSSYKGLQVSKFKEKKRKEKEEYSKSYDFYRENRERRESYSSRYNSEHGGKK